MTKQNPDILCKSCKEFDQSFENGMARCDFLVTCDHDEFEAKKSPYDPSSWLPIPEYKIAKIKQDHVISTKSTEYPDG